MALGGGTWVTQNKVLPGAYINVISAKRISGTVSDRGTAALGLKMDFGPDDEIFEVSAEDFEKDTKALFGCEYEDEKLKPLRDVFKNATTVLLYKLNSSVAAENKFAKAKNSGSAGNQLTIVISKNVGDESKFDVKTLLDESEVDTQTVSDITELTDNDYVIWKKNTKLAETAGVPLTKGSDGEVTGDSHLRFLNKLESWNFNTLACLSEDETTKKLYVNYTKRMRDDIGVKFQLVLHNYDADYEGVINVSNDAVGSEPSALVYWVTGAEAGCPINKSVINKVYDGEYKPICEETQQELQNGIKAGKFLIHQVGKEYRVLTDINSLTTLEENKGELFKKNQVVRVMDQVANDVAGIFNNRFIGVGNNDAGRLSLWNEIVSHHQKLMDIQAIQDFDPADVEVLPGDDVESVLVKDTINPVKGMEKLYMTLVVK